MVLPVDCYMRCVDFLCVVLRVLCFLLCGHFYVSCVCCYVLVGFIACCMLCVTSCLLVVVCLIAA